MDKPMNNLMFNMMSLLFTARDWIISPSLFLSEATLQPGYHVLDYGCGPGSYSLAAAKQVGMAGKVYAMDIQPLAIRRVQARATQIGLNNVVALFAEQLNNLKSESIDVVLLYDVYHMFSQPDQILGELHRVLKLQGSLSFSDHHMSAEALLAGVTCGDRFSLLRKGKKTYTFLKKASGS